MSAAGFVDELPALTSKCTLLPPLPAWPKGWDRVRTLRVPADVHHI